MDRKKYTCTYFCESQYGLLWWWCWPYRLVLNIWLTLKFTQTIIMVLYISLWNMYNKWNRNICFYFIFIKKWNKVSLNGFNKKNELKEKWFCTKIFSLKIDIYYLLLVGRDNLILIKFYFTTNLNMICWKEHDQVINTCNIEPIHKLIMKIKFSV